MLRIIVERSVLYPMGRDSVQRLEKKGPGSEGEILHSESESTVSATHPDIKAFHSPSTLDALRSGGPERADYL